MKNKEVQNFIMLPTVDFCFKELMENPKVRKGFVAALIKINPELIKETRLLPTLLSRNSGNDKLGILDFIHFKDDDTCYRTIHLRDDNTGKLYSDKLEIQILELKKLPDEVKTGDDIIAWMKFFSGKSRKEFEDMANTNEYIDEACNELFKLSADDVKRLEYEAREKAIRDYNSQMNSARRQGEREGEQRGIERTQQIFKLNAQGKSVEEIAKICDVTVEKVMEVLE